MRRQALPSLPGTEVSQLFTLEWPETDKTQINIYKEKKHKAR